MMNDEDLAKVHMRRADDMLYYAREQFELYGRTHRTQDRDHAREDYLAAAREYLLGAVSLQQGRAARDEAGYKESPYPAFRMLQGHLRMEAAAAFDFADYASRLYGGNTVDRDAAELRYARALAETLRDRFGHAEPRLFDRQALAPARDQDARGR